MAKQVVGKGTIQLEFDYNSALKKALSDIEKQWQKVNIASLEEIQAIKKALDEEKKKTQEKQKQKKENDSLKAQQIRLTEEMRKSRGYSKDVTEYIKEMLKNNRLMTQEEKAKLNALKSQGKEQARLARQFGNQLDSINDTNTSLDLTNTAFIAMLYNVNRVGQALFDLTMEAISFNAEIEKSLTISASIASATPEQYDEMLQGVKELGSIAPVELNKIADSMYTLASAGLEAEDILKALPGATKLSVGVGEDLNKVMTALVSTVRGFGKEFSDSEQILDVFANSVASSQATIDKLQVAFARLAPIAEQSNVGFEEMTALLSKLFDTGLSGSRAGTVLVNVLTRLNKFTDQSKEALKEAGLTVYDVSLQYNTLGESLTAVSKAIDEGRLQSDQLQDLFGVRGKLITTITDAIHGQIEAYKELEDEYKNVEGATDRFFDAQEDTVNLAMKKFDNAIARLKMNTGEASKDVFVPLSKTITEIINSINVLAEETEWMKDLIGSIAGVNLVAGKMLDIITKMLVVLIGIKSAGGIGAVTASLASFSAVALPVAGIIGAITVALGLYLKKVAEAKKLEKLAEKQRELNETIEELNELLDDSNSKKLKDIELNEKQKKAVVELEEKTGIYIKTLEDLERAKKNINIQNALERELDTEKRQEFQISELEKEIKTAQGVRRQKQSDYIKAEPGSMTSQILEKQIQSLDGDISSLNSQLDKFKEGLQATNNTIEAYTDFLKPKKAESSDDKARPLDIQALIDSRIQQSFDVLESEAENVYKESLKNVSKMLESGSIDINEFEKVASAIKKKKEESVTRDYAKIVDSMFGRDSDLFKAIESEILKKEGTTKSDVDKAYELYTKSLVTFMDIDDLNIDEEARSISENIENAINEAKRPLESFATNLKAVSEFGESIEQFRVADMPIPEKIMADFKTALNKIGLSDRAVKSAVENIQSGSTIEDILYENVVAISNNYDEKSKNVVKNVNSQVSEVLDNVSKIEDILSENYDEKSKDVVENINSQVSEILNNDSIGKIERLSNEDAKNLEKRLFDIQNQTLNQDIKNKKEIAKITKDGNDKSVRIAKEKHDEIVNGIYLFFDKFSNNIDDANNSIELLKDKGVPQAIESLRGTLSKMGISDEVLSDAEIKSMSKEELKDKISKLFSQIFEANISKLDTKDLTLEELEEVNKREVDIRGKTNDGLKKISNEVDKILDDWSKLSSNLSQIASITGSETIRGISNIIGSGVSGVESFADMKKAGGMFSSIAGFAGGMGVVGAGLSIGSSLLDMAGFGDKSDEIAQTQAEESKEWEEQTDLLKEIKDNLERDLDGLLSLSSELLDSIKNPTLSNISGGTSVLDKIADTLYEQNRDFGELSIKRTERESKGLFKGGEDVDYTESIDLENIYDALNGGVVSRISGLFTNIGTAVSDSGKDIQDLTISELEDFSNSLSTLTTEQIEDMTGFSNITETNFSDVSDAINAYIDLVKTAQAEAREFAKVATLSDFEGIEARTVKDVYEDLKQSYEDAGVEITPEIESELQSMAEDEAIQETMTVQVRDGFVNGFSEGKTIGESMLDGLGNYFEGILTNVSKSFYDTFLDDADTELSDFYKQFAEDLEGVKSSGGDVIDFAEDYDYSAVLGVLQTAQGVSETIDGITESIREQAEALGIDMKTIDELLGDSDNIEFRNSIKSAVESGIKDGFDSGEITAEDIKSSVVGAVIDKTLSGMISNILEDAEITSKINEIISDANEDNLDEQEGNIASLIDLITNQVDGLSDEIQLLQNLKDEFDSDSQSDPIVFFDENNIDDVRSALEDSKEFKLETKPLESVSTTKRIIEIKIVSDGSLTDDELSKIAKEVAEISDDEVSVSKYI